MFKLTISVTSHNLKAIKAELARTLPAVKSSHRCEAVARGLGYRTYASLLTAARSGRAPSATAQGAVFSAYLADHGFKVVPQTLYRALARVAILAVLEREPRLTMHGIGVGYPPQTPNGRRETNQEYNARFHEGQEELHWDSAAEEFLLSLAFLQIVPATKTIRRGTHSYRLKHLAEKYPCSYPEGEKLGPQYVSNGALIAAAIHAGFRYKTFEDELGYFNLNATFNMSKAALDNLDCELRPDGARAQERRRREELKQRDSWWRVLAR